MSDRVERYTTGWNPAAGTFVFDTDDVMTTEQIVSRLNEQHQEIQRLREIIIRAWYELQATPELNMANYDEAQIQKLNDGVSEICCWLKDEAIAAQEEFRDNE